MGLLRAPVFFSLIIAIGMISEWLRWSRQPSYQRCLSLAGFNFVSITSKSIFDTRIEKNQVGLNNKFLQ